MAWSTFHRTWEMVESIVTTHPTTLLRKLFMLLTPPFVNSFRSLCQLILNFISQFIQIKLGGSHPLAQLCNLMTRDFHIEETSQAELHLMRFHNLRGASVLIMTRCFRPISHSVSVRDGIDAWLQPRQMSRPWYKSHLSAKPGPVNFRRHCGLFLIFSKLKAP